MEHYTISNPNVNLYQAFVPKVNLYQAFVDTISKAVRDGVFKDSGIIQNNFSESVHWVIRSLEIKDHEHLVDTYKDILFEIQEYIARFEGQEFMLDAADKIIIEGPTETLEIFLFNATLTLIYISSRPFE